MKDILTPISNLLKALCLLLALVVVFGLSILFIHYNQDFDPFLQDNRLDAHIKIWNVKSLEKDLPAGPQADTIKWGYQLVTKTFALIGPLAKDPSKRYAGNHLACGNCHLNAGTQAGSGSFVGVANRYPQFRGRENMIGSLEDRINGCLERSMNGKTMPVKSPEMRAMVAYMEWLSEEVPPEMQELYQGYAKVVIPQERADTLQGRLFYESKCALCHGDQGQGTPLPGDTFRGYLYPPLGGDDSFNDGAGMNRVITAAEFIKGNMPLGATYKEPLLTDEEAYHIAAFITSLPRPSKVNKEADFPDLTLKPVSTPYGPYADDFSPAQHKYGPYQPIMDFYKATYSRGKKN